MENEFVAYLAWCNFLVRVPHDQWSEQVQRDFAGLEQCKTPYEVGRWLAGAHIKLFSGPAPGRVMPKLYEEGDEAHAHNLCMTIDVRTNDDDLFNRLALFLKWRRHDQNITKKPGRPEFVSRAGAYQLASRPDLNSLDICMTVLEILATHPELTKKEVGEKIAAEYPLAVKLKLQGESSERNKVMSSLGSRYVTKAEAILKGVAQGVFPA